MSFVERGPHVGPGDGDRHRGDAVLRAVACDRAFRDGVVARHHAVERHLPFAGRQGVVFGKVPAGHRRAVLHEVDAQCGRTGWRAAFPMLRHDHVGGRHLQHGMLVGHAVGLPVERVADLRRGVRTEAGLSRGGLAGPSVAGRVVVDAAADHIDLRVGLVGRNDAV